MDLLYYRSSNGNFGDDLNEVMWKALLPPGIWDAEDVVLLGVGSIFNREFAPDIMTRGKRVFVIGSGAGYGPLPEAWQTWKILAVRGPLTAALIGRPELACTDSAVLLGALPQIVRRSEQQGEVLFIPHHHSMNHGKWRSVSERAGLTFVDPRWDLRKVMELFSRARLVVTEAMHGAIIADTLRVPWIPVVTSPDVLPFKWRDWTLSMELEFRPRRLPPSSFWERHHHRFLTRQSQTEGLIAPGLLREIQSADYLVEDFKHRYRNWTPPPKPSHHAVEKSLLKRVMRSATERLDPIFIARAARVLTDIEEGPSYLSKDRVFKRRLQQMLDATKYFTATVL